LILIPIGLFWATYRAWKEENDARLKAEEASPENLRRKVETLEANLARVTGRTPTPENHQRFFETVRRLGIEQFYPPVLCRVGDVEAMNFANQINDLYKELRNSELGIRYSYDAQGEFDYRLRKKGPLHEPESRSLAEAQDISAQVRPNPLCV
jgi:hypothetical protein